MTTHSTLTESTQSRYLKRVKNTTRTLREAKSVKDTHGTLRESKFLPKLTKLLSVPLESQTTLVGLLESLKYSRYRNRAKNTPGVLKESKIFLIP